MESLLRLWKSWWLSGEGDRGIGKSRNWKIRTPKIRFILLDTYRIPLLRGRRATMPRKEARRKGMKKNGSGQRAKPSTPTQAIDAGMAEEEQKTEGRTKERNGERAPNPTTWIIRSPLTWITWWGYFEILHPQGEKFGLIFQN